MLAKPFPCNTLPTACQGLERVSVAFLKECIRGFVIASRRQRCTNSLRFCVSRDPIVKLFAGAGRSSLKGRGDMGYDEPECDQFHPGFSRLLGREVNLWLLRR